MRRTTTATARYVEVEIDLDDIDIDDLRNELIARQVSINGTPALNSEEAHPLHAIYYAFKFGLNDKATELARAYVCDELGVVL